MPIAGRALGLRSAISDKPRSSVAALAMKTSGRGKKAAGISMSDTVEDKEEELAVKIPTMGTDIVQDLGGAIPPKWHLGQGPKER